MNKIKQARQAAGLTQKRMSELLNIPLRTIENWEAGKNTPPEWAEALIYEKLKLIKEKNEMKKLVEFANAYKFEEFEKFASSDWIDYMGDIITSDPEDDFTHDEWVDITCRLCRAWEEAHPDKMYYVSYEGDHIQPLSDTADLASTLDAAEGILKKGDVNYVDIVEASFRGTFGARLDREDFEKFSDMYDYDCYATVDLDGVAELR